MALSAVAWASMLVTLLVVPGVATAALVRSLRSEERKLELLRKQDNIDSYSPRALADLREWIRANPGDPYAPVARERHNECVRSLREIEEPYYDWSEEEIRELETL
ncbi:hypothetical protein [Halomarina litorea]|uniref:hypothetical protein n=1 Tax=Halomarina litorea TaxID=2961595 RepID=UPI0020C45DEE|nr:hypothetical protein [Halomarina sp. BCD28]